MASGRNLTPLAVGFQAQNGINPVAQAGIRTLWPGAQAAVPGSCRVRGSGEPGVPGAAAAAGACAGSRRLQRPVWKTLGKNKLEGKYT